MDFNVIILAHNEEDVIATCISSILRQSLEKNDNLYITVVSNGCSDRTEEIVKLLSEKDKRITLFPIKDSGKVNALRTYLEAFFADLHDYDGNDLLFFMDADVQLNDPLSLRKLADSLTSDKALYAISARCIPESVYTHKSDFVSCLFRVQSTMHNIFRPNIFRGMLYCIRIGILRRISFPQNLLSDDICMEICLDGHFITDYDISITYKLHKGIRREIMRNFMHCLGVLQAYRFLKENKINIIDPLTKKECYKGRYFNKADIVRYLVKRFDFYSLFILGLHNIYYKYNILRASRLLDKYGSEGIDYRVFWRTRK